MRKILLLLLIATGVVQWQWRHPPELEEVAAETPPPVSTAPAPTAEIVHCRLGDTGSFIRRSECAEQGGRIDEPVWARSG